MTNSADTLALTRIAAALEAIAVEVEALRELAGAISAALADEAEVLP